VAETEPQSAPQESVIETTPIEQPRAAETAPEPVAETESQLEPAPAPQESVIEARQVEEPHAAQNSLEPAKAEATAKSITPAIPNNDITGQRVEILGQIEPAPSEPTPSADAPIPKAVLGGAASMDGPVPAEAESCLKSILEQLTAAAPSRGRSMSTIVLKNSKVLLSSWEVASFVSDAGQDSEDLRRAVVARAMIALAMDSRKQTGESASLVKAIEWARTEISYFQDRIEQLKVAKSIEAVVNLGISTKRLLSFVEEAEKLQP